MGRAFEEITNKNKKKQLLKRGIFFITVLDINICTLKKRNEFIL